MWRYLADKVGATVLALSQLMLTNVAGTDPSFQEVRLELRGSGIHVSTVLMDSFTEDLDIMLQSGDTLVVHFEVDLVLAENDSIVAMANWHHQFRYSLLEDRYHLFFSEEGEWDNIYSFEDARQRWVQINEAYLCEMELLQPRHRYYLRLSAYMDNVQLPGLTEQLNLMSFWNRIRPSYKSPPFEKRSLIL